MGFNYICHIVQLSQSLTKTLSFSLKLLHGGVDIVPSLLINSVLLIKEKNAIVCIHESWFLCKTELFILGLRANVCILRLLRTIASWQVHVWASGQQLL